MSQASKETASVGEQPLLYVGAEAPGDHDAVADSPVVDKGSTCSLGALAAAQFQAGSIKATVTTLMSALVGAGMLALPLAFRQAGLLVATFLTLKFASFNHFSLKLLVAAATRTRRRSYESLAELAGGPRLRTLVQVCLLLNLFGTTVAYAVASGNLAHMGVEALWGHTGFWGSAPVLTVVLCGLIALPIGLQRSMSSLRFSSLMGIACSLLLVTVVVTKYFVYCARGEVVCFWNGLSTKYLLPESSHDYLHALPLILYSYTCHPNVLPLYAELQRPCDRRMHKVVTRAFAAAAFLYVLVGSTGFLTFLYDTEGNILMNNYHREAAPIAACFAICFTVVSAMPLFVHSFRACFEDTFFRGHQFSLVRHVFVTVLVLSAAVAVSIGVGDLATVLAFMGASVNPVVCFVLPTVFFVKTFPGPEERWRKFGGIFLSACFMLISVCSLMVQFGMM